MLDLGLTGKVAIVTGGSAGLGRAAAIRLAGEGVRVSICARRKEVLERTAGEIRHAGGDVLAIPADVTRAEDVQAVVTATTERFGGVDILLNNAGTSAAAAFMDVDDRTWQTDIELKLMAAIRFCRLTIPIMQKRGGGVIVNVTTVGGKAPAPRAVPTAVTRAAGINLTKGLANEYASSGIRVNTICLGLVKRAVGAPRQGRRRRGRLSRSRQAGADRPHGRGRGVRRPRRVPGLRPRCLHHGHRDQLRRRHGRRRVTIVYRRDPRPRRCIQVIWTR
jgi:3-oxoacyl-[acyl-carrier protein] reductase